MNSLIINSQLSISELAQSIAESLSRFASLTEKYLDILTSPPCTSSNELEHEFKQTLQELVTLDQTIAKKVEDRKYSYIYYSQFYARF